jgi:hypothetical protein
MINFKLFQTSLEIFSKGKSVMGTTSLINLNIRSQRGKTEKRLTKKHIPIKFKAFK